MLVIRPIVPLSMAVLVACSAAPGNAFPAETIAPATLSFNAASAATVMLLESAVDDYQPPNNGGPGKTGGSGTRWH